MKNILIAFDFAENASLLIKKATELAEKFNSKLWLVHIAAPDPDFVGYGPGPQYIRDFRAEDLREEHITLQKLADDIISKGIETEALLVQGPTVETILEEAEKLNADLIILGKNEHGALHNFWYGNTTYDVVKESKIPLLIIPLH